MIDGLKVTVKGDELRQLCQGRSDHHRKRAEQYTQQAAIFKDEPDPDPMSSASNKSSPKRDLQHKAREHKDQSSEMAFIADHLEPTETYLLGRSDLQKLGIVTSAY